VPDKVDDSVTVSLHHGPNGGIREPASRRVRALRTVVPLGAALAIASCNASSEPPLSAPVSSASSTESPSGSSAEEPPNRAEPAYSACSDPAGDSTGYPDLILVALDRPAYPFIHFHWDRSRLPADASVEALFSATSADGQRSRHFVVVIRNGSTESQYVLDPGTGERVVQRQKRDAGSASTAEAGRNSVDIDFSSEGVSASFPGSTVSPLSGGWTWTASVAVNGTVVDVCDTRTD
jgi:hypothetical protein